MNTVFEEPAASLAASGLTLRPSATADREFAFRVWKAAMEQYIDATWGWDETTQHRRQRVEFAERTYQIIEAADQPVGTCIVERQPDCFYVSGLYILPEYQKRGIGSIVLKVLVSEGQAHKLPIRLRVLKVNPAAQRLYERNGFVVTDETGPDFRVMEKSPAVAL